MQKYILMITIAVCSLLAGCSSLQFPGVYKITIEQGNVITQDMVDQLKPDRSKDQVEYIMGSPLIKDSFNTDRWDYVYNVQHGDETREQYRLSIFFEADSLKYFSGDFTPSAPIPADSSENDSKNNTES